MLAIRMLSLIAIMTPGFAQAQAVCDPPQRSAGSFEVAISRISQLPDFAAWKSNHSFPVAYGLGADRQEAVRGKCFWEVPVYADRPERFEHWETFYVAADSETIYVFDATLAQPITLAEWRKGREQ
jgi:hypothetical protein